MTWVPSLIPHDFGFTVQFDIKSGSHDIVDILLTVKKKTTYNTSPNITLPNLIVVANLLMIFVI